MGNKEILVRSVELTKLFPLKKKSILQKEKKYLRANDKITLDIYKGETLGLVGESGCGKSTYGRTLIQLQNQDSGSTLYYGSSLYTIKPKYVADVYANISKMFSGLDLANQNKSKEDLSLLRLCGGLLAHPDLDRVSRVLLKCFKDGMDNQELVDLKDEVVTLENYNEYQSYYDEGIDLTELTSSEMATLRKDIQIIFQNPYSSLDPRMKVGDIIGEGVTNFKDQIPDAADMEPYIKGIMERCGLDANYYSRFPHQFSGGERQRISIARTLAIKPKFIVCDESVSALDVSIQAQVLNLLQELKRDNDLTYLFITHDLGVVRYISDRIGVMYFGHLVELAPADELFKNPQHPYTKMLLEAVPNINFEKDGKHEDILDSIDYPGIGFDFVYDREGNVDPDWVEVSKDHFVRCIDRRVSDS